ncbi:MULTISPECIES: alpha/beta hydrolase [unclassified Beijerinckia]|uniref:alpha/beta fold hydrolase n=1 Tax=unclassified Beijerinckia TaxID=2638183 RepID=UPI00089B0CE3|nr:MULTISPECIES: alpha/beta hydrolase [unclassified Beijerinckia]MDH7799327.1 pimeloyl-ACP methyl ester carboxylesterase [Beijerinckia sp. GAS462]SED46376.1 Pimeloyl-ACP methyl ester carboxylesterase [Beijerinckia sp. 28-YEA-48]
MLSALALVLAALLAVSLALFLFTGWQTRRLNALYPARGQFVDVEGARIHFTDTPAIGATKGAVLLLHGASGNEADMRLPLAGRLAALGYRVISVDRPGLGRSARLGGPDDASPARQAQLLRAAAEKIGVTQAIVVGHSLAGVLSLQLALDHRSFTQGLVLIAPVSHPWPGGIAAYYTAAALPFIGPLFSHTITLPIGLALIAPSLTAVFHPQMIPGDYRSRTGIDLVLRPASFRANAQDVAVIEDFVKRQAPRYRSIAVPTIIVTGDKDGIVYTHIHSAGCARDIPGATLTVLPGIGHSPHWAYPDAVVQAILQVTERMKIPRL